MKKQTQSGFTLPEIFVVIAILGVLMSIVVPEFGSLLTKSRMAAAVNEINGLIVLARNTAVTLDRGVVGVGIDPPAVIVCSSDDVTVDEPVCSDEAVSGKKSGLVAFISYDGDNIIEDDDAPADRVLRIVQSFEGDGITVYAFAANNTAAISANALTYISFDTNGQPLAQDTPIGPRDSATELPEHMPFTVQLCDSRGAADSVAFVIGIAGLARKAVEQNGTGIVADHNGVDVVCP